jgi:hypothetical protein
MNKQSTITVTACHSSILRHYLEFSSTGLACCSQIGQLNGIGLDDIPTMALTEYFKADSRQTTGRA